MSERLLNIMLVVLIIALVVSIVANIFIWRDVYEIVKGWR